MMAGLFTLMTLVIVVLYFGRQKPGFILLLVTLGLCIVMLLYHAADTLKINW